MVSLSRRITLFSLVLTLALGMSQWAQAAPSDQQERIAAGLHQKALEHFKAGRYDEAVQNWEAAEALHRYWKYAFNMALALQADEQWLRAWEACGRATTYGLPERNQPALDQLVELVETELLTDHAHITLKVTPGDANVIRNGGLWTAPWSMWTRDGLSDLVVSHGQHGVKQQTWKHPPGKRYELAVSLVAAPPVAVPAPVAAPEPAPVAEPEPTPQGDMMEEVTAEAPPAEEIQVSVDAGVSTTRESTGSSPAMGWIALGTSGAALAGAIVSLSRHSALAEEIEALNANPDLNDHAAYLADYDAKRAEADSAQTMGLVAAAVGTGLLAFGTWWLLEPGDGGDDADEVEAALAPVLLPGGAGLGLGGRF